jgi:hypothetical protein
MKKNKVLTLAALIVNLSVIIIGLILVMNNKINLDQVVICVSITAILSIVLLYWVNYKYSSYGANFHHRYPDSVNSKH